jgi:hypothetical protein
MDKAADNRDLAQRFAPAVISVLGSMGLSAYLNHRLKQQLDAMPRSRDKQSLAILRHAGLPSDMPVVSYPGLENAAYIGAGEFDPWFGRGLHEQDEVLDGLVRRNPGLLKRLKRYGVIALDPEYSAPGVVGHEAGHSAISQGPWYSPSRINQDVLRPLMSLPASILPAIAAGAVGIGTKNPLYGGGAGALAGLLLNAPTLISEYQASRNAKKYIDQSRMTSENKARNHEGLNSAFHTYLANAVAPAALAGLASGGIAMVNK